MVAKRQRQHDDDVDRGDPDPGGGEKPRRRRVPPHRLRRYSPVPGKKSLAIVDRLALADGQSGALFILDHELGSREGDPGV
jgi:hypothetical protein